MISVYPACYYKEKGGGYSVIFPGLDIATCGDTLDEAQRMAADCLAGFIHDARLEKTEVPYPPHVEDIDVNARYDGYESAFIDTVAVDVEEYAREYFGENIRKVLTIPVWLNDMALDKETDMSCVLERALKEEFGIS